MKVGQREREKGGRAFWGNRGAARSASHSPGAPGCCASHSQLFFFCCLVPTLDQRRDVLWKGLNFATFGKFRSRCVGTSPGVCEWWRTFGRRLRIELGDAEGDVLGENFTVTSRPASYCGLFQWQEMV